MTREANVGASRVAAIVGLDPYRSDYDVWLELTGRAEPWRGNDATRRGQRLEPVLIDYYRELHPDERVISGGEYRLKGTPILAHPDARAYRAVGAPPHRVIEAKSAAIEAAGHADTTKWGDAGTDQVPDHYLVQTQVQMAAVGCDEASIPAIIGGRGFVEYLVPRSDRLVARLVEMVVTWYDLYVVGDRPPEGKPPSLDTLARVIRREGKAVEVERSLVSEWVRCRDDAKRAEQAQDEARARLLAALGDGDEGTVDGQTWITYRLTRPSKPRVDADELRARHPDVYAEVSRVPEGYRVLRATKAASEEAS